MSSLWPHCFSEPATTADPSLPGQRGGPGVPGCSFSQSSPTHSPETLRANPARGTALGRTFLWPLSQQNPYTWTACQPRVTQHTSFCPLDPSGTFSGMVQCLPLSRWTSRTHVLGGHGGRDGSTRLSPLLWGLSAEGGALSSVLTHLPGEGAAFLG